VHSTTGDVKLSTQSGSILDAAYEQLRPKSPEEVAALQALAGNNFSLAALQYPLSVSLIKYLYPDTELPMVEDPNNPGQLIPMVVPPVSDEAFNIIGRKVILSTAGSGTQVGQISGVTVIDISDADGFSGLTQTQQLLLSRATVNDILDVKRQSGKTIVTLRLVDDIDIAADANDSTNTAVTVTIDAVAGVALQTDADMDIDHIRSGVGGDVLLQVGGAVTDIDTSAVAAITTFGDLSIRSGGNVSGQGTPESTLRVQIAADKEFSADVGGDLRLRQVDGSVTLYGVTKNISNLNIDNVLTSTDTFIEVMKGNLNVGLIEAGDDIDLQAYVGSILDRDTDAADLIAAGDALLKASLNVGASGNFLDVDIAGVFSAQVGDSVYLHSMDQHDLTIGAITAGALVHINAELAIVDQPEVGVPDTDITAADAILIAVNGVGSGLNPLETQINRLEAEISAGGIWLDNTGNLQIGGISSQVGIKALTTVDISALGSITVDEAIDTANGPVLLDAATDIHVNDAITSGGGRVTLKAQRDITFAANGFIDTETGAATVRLLADWDGVSNDGKAVDGGGIRMTDGSFVDARDGLIDADATDDIVISLLRTTSDVAVDSSAGAILDAAEALVNEDIVAQNALLNAAQGIGLDNDPLETILAYLEGTGGSGGIFIENAQGLVIGAIVSQALPAAASSNGLRADRTIRVRSAGFMTVLENVASANEDVLLQAIDSAAVTELTSPDLTKYVTTNDGSAFDEDLIVSAGADISAGQVVRLLAGDDMLIDRGSEISAGVRIELSSDFADADPLVGSRIDMIGSLSSVTNVISGGRASDTLYLQPQALSGHTQVLGDRDGLAGGVDTIILDQLPSIDTSHDRPNHLKADGSDGAVRDTVDLDGRGGTDVYIVNVTAALSSYLVNVHDSGAPDDGVDTLTINGTVNGDVFLLREHFVALLTKNGSVEADGRPGFETEVQRINYDRTVNGRLTVNGGLGDDEFYMDDNSAITTLDGGQGKDLFQIGQVLGTNPNGYDYADPNRIDDVRVVANDVDNIDLTSDSDDIALTQITRGWLSRGASYATTVFGGEQGDTFNIYSNKAVLRLEGEAGNDNFVIRAFIAEDDIIANGGDDDDNFEYNINAPLSINGGAGFDTVTVLGTERDDNFIITADGIFGAGLSVRVDGVEESLEVDGLEGNDQFFILSTRDNVVTTVIGGLGSDTFNVAGDVTAQVISQDLNGRSSVINHGAASVDNNYNQLLVDGIAVTIADQTQGKVVIDETGGATSGYTELLEDVAGFIDSYRISLIAPLTGLHNSTIGYLTVSAALSSSADRRLNTRNAINDPLPDAPHEAESVLISLDGVNYSSAAVIKFTQADWESARTVFVKAAHDDAIEGERKVMISHSLQIVSDSAADIAAYDNVAIRNVEAKVVDDDLGSLIVLESGGSTRVLEGGDVVDTSGNTIGNSAIDDTYTVQLSVQPEAGELVTVSLAFDSNQIQVFEGNNPNPVTSLTFDANNWNTPLTLTVKAVNDAVRENSIVTRITHGFSSTDVNSVYANAPSAEVAVSVVDNDSLRVLVTETDGGTRLVQGQSGDSYSLRLVSEPTGPVTVNLYGDGQTQFISNPRVFMKDLGTAQSTAVAFIDGVSQDQVLRTDSGSWIADGFRVGTLFQINGTGPLYKVNSLTANALTLTSGTQLTSGNQGTVSIQRLIPAVTFDASNWYQEVSIGIEIDTTFTPDPGQQFVRQEPIREHTVNRIAGPLIVEGGVAVGKDRSIKPAVMLPTESTALPKAIDLNIDETKQADRLNVFNDSSRADDKGWLDEVTPDSNAQSIIKLDNAYNISGLGMRTGVDGRSTSLTLDISDDQSGTFATFFGGITFDDIEVTDIMLGQGNDTFNISATSSGTPDASDKVITVVHGGGNTVLSNGQMGGDNITVTGGGGVNSPLVIFGDTSQDGSRYDSRPDLGAFSGNAVSFLNAGNDIIDARAAQGGVTIYGGVGNDVIWGSQGDDHLAGGSGDDEIHGQGGLDHIYGDSGFNLDYAVVGESNGPHSVARLLSVPTANVSAIYTRDNLLSGSDTLFGDQGDDIIFGDHGVIDQVAGTLRLLTTGNVTRIATDQPNNGQADVMNGGSGYNRILGGLGGDTITGGDDGNLIFGDHGFIDFTAFDGDLTDIDIIESSDFNNGGIDSIKTGEGNDIIIGGTAGDLIDAGQGHNIVFGDHGRILSAFAVNGSADLTARLDNHPVSLGRIETIAPTQGGNDTIITGQGRDIILGGFGSDLIFAYGAVSSAAGLSPNSSAKDQDKNNLVIGDNGYIDYVKADGDARDIDEIASTEVDEGGQDTIHVGDANDIVIGGAGADEVNDGNGFAIIIADSGILTSMVGYDADSAFSAHPFMLGCFKTLVSLNDGSDTIVSGAGGSVIFGGLGNDVIYAGEGNDLVFGEYGEVCTNLVKEGCACEPFVFTDQNNNAYGTFGFRTIDMQVTGQFNDTIFGEGGKDIILGQQGDDVIYGGNGDDILIGGHNVAGGLDGNDRIDGGVGNDAIAGDNAEICYREDHLDPRMRALLGTTIYGITGQTDGRALVVPLETGHNGAAMPLYADPRSTSQYKIVLLDHTDTTSNLFYGNDYIAGGAGEDEIFGQLGNDVIQGDGTIGVKAGDDFARNLAAAQLSLTLRDGSIYTINDFTRFGSNRGSVPTELADFGFTMDPSEGLVVIPSFEGRDDGDDYVEGGGGNDVILGNRGQDDLIGGSSNLFGLTTAAQSPDGSDLIFGGAGTRIDRNDIGDATRARTPGLPSTFANDLIINQAGGHAHDADVIIGDNGLIFRLVGINGVQRNNGNVFQSGVRSTGGYLNFNYDFNGSAAQGYGSDGNSATYDYIVVRAVEFLDYHEGGIDIHPGALNDRGAGDEIHGEAGDDTLYGMKGNDVLFGDGQDDDLIGGYGNDWISGGTGDDGVIGDDGRFIVSRNATTYGEPLYGVVALLPDNGDTRTFNGNMMNEAIATPGSIQQAVVNVAGELKKAVNLTPFSFDPNFNGDWDEFTTVNRKTVDDQGLPGAPNANDIIFGGLGNDSLHGGSGDDAILGGEALSLAYTQVYNAQGQLTGVTRSDFYRPYNPGDALAYNPEDPDGWHFDSTRRAGEFALYDEYDPLRKITLNADGTANKTNQGGLEWFLNFSATEGSYVPAGTTNTNGNQATSYGQAWNDGNDKIFGGAGNDWLVGGTGKDNLYGGFGNDLLNADDDHRTNGGLNNQPDTQPSYEDRAFGGAGRDVLIGNTGGDRLIDWVGEFNSYLVPFAPFGMATVSRTLQPQLAEFLYTLSASDGADPTRAADTGSDPARNGEPEGELGVVRQKDFAWQSQTGAPADPQAGNIPGGKRDVLRTANFNDGRLQGLASDSGTWEVNGGLLRVAATSNQNDAVSVYHVGDALPSYFEVQARIQVIKPTSGWKANSYVIFDYQSPTNFKFAGLNVSTNKLEIGQRTAAGWQVLSQSSVQGGIKDNTWYNLTLSVNGLTATLNVDNRTTFSHIFQPTVIDGWSYALNWGLVGFGSDRSRGAMDNITVQVLPPAVTAVRTDDFASGTGEMVSGDADSRLGTWNASAGRLIGAPLSANATAIQLLNLSGVTQMSATSLLELNTTFNTTGRAGIVFDRYSDTDFKFAAVDVVSKQVMIGHRTASGWTIDAAVSNLSLTAGTDYKLGISIKGATVSASLNDQAAVGFVFNAVGTDGRFGLFTRSVTSSFDSVMVKTNDPRVPANNLQATVAPAFVSQNTVSSLAQDDIAPILAEAKRRWAASGLLDGELLARLNTITVRLEDFGGLILAQQDGNTLHIDLDAAGWGWFVDPTADKNEEYRRNSDGTLSARKNTDASDKMDLLTVVMHEIGHLLGYDHGAEINGQTELMDSTLSAGARELLDSTGISYFDDDAGSFVQAEKQNGKVENNKQRGDFLIITDANTKKPRQMLYDFTMTDDDHASDSETRTDEAKSLKAKLKKMAGRMSWKK